MLLCRFLPKHGSGIPLEGDNWVERAGKRSGVEHFLAFPGISLYPLPASLTLAGTGIVLGEHLFDTRQAQTVA